jgi:SET domain-containing protein
MNKKKLLEHLQNDIYCRVGVSKFAGVGVLAIKDIPKGTNPFKHLSKEKEKIVELTESDVEKLNPNVKRLLRNFFGNGNTYDVLAAGPNYINISFYLNNSKNPNLDIIETDNSEYLEFITNRDIKEGEELMIDYSKYN